MKILTIGDIHGRSCWKELALARVDEFDKIVFIGDYCDSFNVDPITILKNLREIIQFKRDFSDKVELLLGNHDIHYMKPGAPIGSGWNSAFHHQYKEVFNQNEEVFKVAFQFGDHLWTHAGVHDRWFKDLHDSCWNPEGRFYSVISDENPTTIADLINYGFMTGNFLLWDTKVGPFWIRPNKLRFNGIQGITQIVGHTFVEDIHQDDGVWYVDCLDFQVKGLELQIDL